MSAGKAGNAVAIDSVLTQMLHVLYRTCARIRNYTII